MYAHQYLTNIHYGHKYISIIQSLIVFLIPIKILSQLSIPFTYAMYDSDDNDSDDDVHDGDDDRVYVTSVM